MGFIVRVLCTCGIIFLAATDPSVEASRQFKVGGHLGWHEPGPNNTAFYSQWAERNRFQIGDSLLFEYQNDSVLAVDKWHYFHCDSRDFFTAFDNGNSTFNLDRPGAFYFVSGTDDHCNKGQKLLVEVMSPHPIPKSPPSISMPPEGFSAMAPSPSHSPGISTSPSHHSSGVSTSVVLCSVFMSLSVTLVLVPLLAP